jgi:hypothetical protein
MPKQTTAVTRARIAIPVEVIERRIFLIRGHKVMLDADLADLYQVATGNLNLAIKRNPARFPVDFMFRLTKAEFQNLRLQSASSRWGGRRYQPYAFTEHGIAMLSAVLNTRRAIHMSLHIVRAFIRLREFIANNRQLASRVAKLELQHKRHASVISILASEIDNLKQPTPIPPRRRIGFRA